MPSMAHGKIEGIEARDASFFEAVRGVDDLGVVLRAQIHIEHELRGFIVSQARAPEQVKFEEMDFEGATRLALILGLNCSLKSALAAVGTLRNRFAHTLTAQLEDQEANNLYAALGERLKAVTQDTFKRMQSKDRKAFPGAFKSLSSRDRIIFMLIAVRSAVVAERLIAERKKIETAAL